MPDYKLEQQFYLIDMKKLAPLFLAIACLFSFHGFSQRSERVLSHAKTGNAQLMSDNMSNNDLAVVSYHVEEKVNMAFGSYTTTYDVSSLSLVSTNDLGPNNTRTVTPKYGKAKTKTTAFAIPMAATVNTGNKEQPKAAAVDLASVMKSVKIDAVATENKMKYVNIDILNTYERILEKGYKSREMLLRVANSRYFAGDLTLAAKWYSQLFDEKTDDLDVVYYFRFSQSLKAIGQLDKAKKMMAVYDVKSVSEK